MRDAFDLVKGAVSEKDLIPVLTHFAIHEGRIHGFNGRIHLSAPAQELASFQSFTVAADLLLAAMNACGKKEPSFMKMNDTLFVRAGDFEAKLPLGDIAQFPIPTPPVVPKVHRRKGLLPVLQTLRPFIGEDASRPWCASIRFEGDFAYATNNVVLAGMPLPKGFLLGTCALPVHAVDELLRLDCEPQGVVLEGSDTLFFFLPRDVYLRSNLIVDGWPNAGELLGRIHAVADPASWIGVTPALLEAVQGVTPLCPDPKQPAIVLDNTQVKTRSGASTACVGGFQGLAGTYHPKALELVLASATEAAWGCAPRVPWRGAQGLLGALVGLVG